MAKSKQQKQEEALQRGRVSYPRWLNNFILLSPAHLCSNKCNFKSTDMQRFMQYFDAMRRHAAELKIHYDGTGAWSNTNTWSTGQLFMHLLESKTFVPLCQEIYNRLVAIGLQAEPVTSTVEFSRQEAHIIQLLQEYIEKERSFNDNAA